MEINCDSYVAKNYCRVFLMWGGSNLFAAQMVDYKGFGYDRTYSSLALFAICTSHASEMGGCCSGNFRLLRS